VGTTREVLCPEREVRGLLRREKLPQVMLQVVLAKQVESIVPLIFDTIHRVDSPCGPALLLCEVGTGCPPLGARGTLQSRSPYSPGRWRSEAPTNRTKCWVHDETDATGKAAVRSSAVPRRSRNRHRSSAAAFLESGTTCLR